MQSPKFADLSQPRNPPGQDAPPPAPQTLQASRRSAQKMQIPRRLHRLRTRADLAEVLAPAQIAALLDAPAEAACRGLIDAAYAAGSRGNISAVVVRVV